MGASSRSGLLGLGTVDVLIGSQDAGEAELALALSVPVSVTGFGIKGMGSNPASVAQFSKL